MTRDRAPIDPDGTDPVHTEAAPAHTGSAIATPPQRAMAPGGERRRWLALAVLCTIFFVSVTDSTIVYTALPSIDDDLNFAGSGVEWIILAYALTTGGFLLLGGRAADLLGRRRMFMVGVTVFTAASLLCGFSWSAGMLIAARAAEGIGAAIMTPAALSILMATFPDGPARNKALGIWGSLGGIGATVGLLLGGPITDGLGWEWVFFVNVPIGVAVLVLAPLLLSESRERHAHRSFDGAGAFTITGGLLALVYALVQAPDHGWSSVQTIGLLATAIALICSFVIIESRSSAPLVPLRIFRSRTLVGGNVVVLAAGMSVDAVLFGFTLYAQQVLGYSAVQFGLAMGGMTVMSFVGVFAGQHFVTNVGFRIVATVGMVLIGAGSLLLTQVSDTSGFVGVIAAGLAIFWPGMGAAFVASQIAALAGVAERDAGLASGIEETAFSVGSTMGVAIASTIVASHADLAAGIRTTFGAVVVFAAVGLVAAVVLLRSPAPAAAHTGEPFVADDVSRSPSP